MGVVIKVGPLEENVVIKAGSPGEGMQIGFCKKIRARKILKNKTRVLKVP